MLIVNRFVKVKMEISKKLRNRIEKLFNKWETPIDAFGWEDFIDIKKSNDGNVEYIEKMLRDMNPDKFPDLPTKKEIDEKDIEATVKYVQEVEADFEKSIQELKGKTTNILDNYFKTVKENTEVLMKSEKINGYILRGGTAIGKSYGVIQSLAQFDLKNEENYIVLTSHITALELYQYLYKNNGKIIVCDDVMLLFKDDIKKGMLLSALWSPTGKRVVEYHTSSSKLKVPPKFEFTGKIIVICNNFPKELESLKSRCLYQDLVFNVKQKKEIICEICKLENIPMEIFDFIKENCDESTQNLNFRLPIKIHEIYKNKNENWRELALTQIEGEKKIYIIKGLLNSGKSKSEMLEDWEKATGLKRSRMYDYVNLYKERAGFSDFPRGVLG